MLIAQLNVNGFMQQYLASKTFFFFTFRMRVSLSMVQKRPTAHGTGRSQGRDDHKKSQKVFFKGDVFHYQSTNLSGAEFQPHTLTKSLSSTP